MAAPAVAWSGDDSRYNLVAALTNSIDGGVRDVPDGDPHVVGLSHGAL